MTEMLPIGVVIPVLNRVKLVVEAMDSIAAQTLLPKRLVVVDAESTDGTPEAVKTWMEEKDRGFECVLLSHPPGVSRQRNLGAEQCRDCELMAFLDSDDLWPKDFLQRAITAFGENQQAVGATCDLLIIDYHKNEREQLNHIPHLTERTTEKIFCDPMVPPSASVLRTEQFWEAGAFPPDMNLAEDWLLSLKMSLVGPWLYLPGEPVKYRNGLAAKTGAASQASGVAPERHRARSRMLESFIFEHGGKDVIPESVWKERLSRVWYSAGRNHAKFGEKEIANECFEKCLEFKPGHFRARLRKLFGF